MKERVTFYVDGFKYTIPEEWDKKRKKSYRQPNSRGK
jgi:hypothetical protein